MAVASDMADDIVDVFTRLKQTEMTLSELYNHLRTRNHRKTIDEVFHLIQRPNLANLFTIQSLSKDSVLIRLAPKVNEIYEMNIFLSIDFIR